MVRRTPGDRKARAGLLLPSSRTHLMSNRFNPFIKLNSIRFHIYHFVNIKLRHIGNVFLFICHFIIILNLSVPLQKLCGYWIMQGTFKKLEKEGGACKFWQISTFEQNESREVSRGLKSIYIKILVYLLQSVVAHTQNIIISF